MSSWLQATTKPRRFGILVVVVAAVVTGCASGGSSQGAAPSPTAVASPTATMPALPDVTPGAGALAACAGAGGTPLSLGQIVVGPFDSWQELSSDLPLKPELVTTAAVIGNLALSGITVDVIDPMPTGRGLPPAVTSPLCKEQTLRWSRHPGLRCQVQALSPACMLRSVGCSAQDGGPTSQCHRARRT
jgi:hypothetical protein